MPSVAGVGVNGPLPRPFTAHYEDGKQLVDFIGHFETLEQDYEPIRKKYGFSPLKHYNKTEYGDWCDYYTTALAKKVYRKFRKDIQYFGYEEDYRDLLAYCAKKGL